MENPIELKPLEPLSQPTAEQKPAPAVPEELPKKHKGLSLGKLISIFTGVLLVVVVIGVIIYSQSSQKLKGDITSGPVAGEAVPSSPIAGPVISESISPAAGITTAMETGAVPTAEDKAPESPAATELAGTDAAIAGVSDTGVAPGDVEGTGLATNLPDTAISGMEIPIVEIPEGLDIKGTEGEEATSPAGDAVLPESAASGILTRGDAYENLQPSAPKDDSAYIPADSGDIAGLDTQVNRDLLDEALGAFTTKCDQYKAELDYAYYHEDWTGSEKSYAASLTALNNNNCISECDYAFYDGILQLAYGSYMLDSGFNPSDPTNRPVGANASIINLLANCTDKCDKIFDLYAFFVEFAKTKAVYTDEDREMMHELIDRNINTVSCTLCRELEDPVFNESKYFTKEFESIIDEIRAAPYAQLYLNAAALESGIPYEEPPIDLGNQVSLPVAYAASIPETIPLTTKATEAIRPSDAVFMSAENAVLTDISSYLEGKCPEPVPTATCTEVRFVDPANPATVINSIDAVYNQTINNVPLLVQATGVSGSVRYEFSTDTPINTLFQFTDTTNTGNPLITSVPRVNLFTNEIVTIGDEINVRVIDENNNLVGACTSQIALMLADSASEEVPPSDVITEGSEPVPSASTSGSGSPSTTTTTTTTTSTSSGGSSGTTTGGGTSSGTTSGGSAGGTLPRCSSLEIIKPNPARASGTPTVNVSENGYVNENLTINVNTSAGVVSKYRFKSLNGTISFNNQGTTVDVPATTQTVMMNGGPNAGEQDTVTVWALDNSNQGIQSCHDAFIVSVPAALVAGAPVGTQPAEDAAVMPASHPASPSEPSTPSSPSTPEQPSPMPVVHEGAETAGEAPAEEGTMPPMTPDDGPGVLVYFIGAGLGGLIFSRKKKNK